MVILKEKCFDLQTQLQRFQNCKGGTHGHDKIGSKWSNNTRHRTVQKVIGGNVRIQLNNRMMGVWLFLKDYIILREIGWGKDGGEIPKPWELYHKINKYCVTIQIEDSGKIPETAVK